MPIATSLTASASIGLELFAEWNAIDVVLLGYGSDCACKHIRHVASFLIRVHVLSGRMNKTAIIAKAALVLKF
jgi:hypothetical protein